MRLVLIWWCSWAAGGGVKDQIYHRDFFFVWSSKDFKQKQTRFSATPAKSLSLLLFFLQLNVDAIFFNLVPCFWILYLRSKKRWNVLLWTVCHDHCVCLTYVSSFQGSADDRQIITGPVCIHNCWVALEQLVVVSALHVVLLNNSESTDVTDEQIEMDVCVTVYIL